MREYLAGFQARVAVWPPVGFLKRPVRRVCSVDTLIWPPWFGVEPEDPANWRRGEWDSLEALSRQEVAGAVILATTVWLREDERLGVRHSDGTFYDNTPSLPGGSVDPTWRRLGWDVAEMGTGISALCNCGGDWTDGFPFRLNDEHLFEQVGDALAFRDLADTEVPEHAPFYVAGVYLVRAPPGVDIHASPTATSIQS